MRLPEHLAAQFAELREQKLAASRAIDEHLAALFDDAAIAAQRAELDALAADMAPALEALAAEQQRELDALLAAERRELAYRELPSLPMIAPVAE